MGGSKKDEKPEIPSDDPELEQIFRDLCNDEWQTLTLVNHLEGTSYSRHANNEEDLSFCKSYTIALIQTYCKSTTWEEADNGKVKPKRIGDAEDKVEFVLAMYGLLKGFEFKKKSLSKRKRKYYDYAHGHNELVSGVWDGASIDTKTRDVLYDIAWELTNTLHNLKEPKNGGKLGFLNEAPKELTLPSPRNFDKQPSPEPEPTPGGSTGRISLTQNVQVPFWAVLIIVFLWFCQLPRCSATLTRYSDADTGEKFTQLVIQNEPQHREYANLPPSISIGNDIYYEYSPSAD